MKDQRVDTVGNPKEKKNKYIWMIAKYAFSFLLVLATMKTTKSISHTIASLVELIVLIFISDLLVRKNKIFTWVSSLIMLIFNAENIVLLFSGSFVTYVMLENIGSIQDLAGKAIIYGAGAAVGIGFSFFPVYPIPKIKWKISGSVCAIAFALELVCIRGWGNDCSPVFAVTNIYYQWKMQVAMHMEIGEMDEAVLNSFYKGREQSEIEEQEEAKVVEVTEEKMKAVSAFADESEMESDISEVIDQDFLHGYTTSGPIQKNSCTLNQPNVILIFTEGLSQNVIDDERMIMPNARSLQQQSLSFKNYYNHTFATYRGLIGQLYSGHQLEDYDTNSLISIQEIMKGQGYYTSFINTEPNNSQFCSYLGNFGFDAVISDPIRCNGTIGSMNDAEAYDFLFETAQQYDAQMEQPFFITIYTFGTHTTFDSVDSEIIFGDGSNRVLNRFYYADVQLGRFLENFKNSSLASDTIIIFTADHCTYADADFVDAFPDYNRECTDVDRIPFFIYYVGGPVASVNAYGRNSLDMAPTVLDFLNISAPNYFLGESLFSEKTDELCLDMFFYDPAYLKITDGGKVRSLDDATADYVYGRIREYFAVK